MHPIRRQCNLPTAIHSASALFRRCYRLNRTQLLSHIVVTDSVNDADKDIFWVRGSPFDALYDDNEVEPGSPIFSVSVIA